MSEVPLPTVDIEAGRREFNKLSTAVVKYLKDAGRMMHETGVLLPPPENVKVPISENVKAYLCKRFRVRYQPRSPSKLFKKVHTIIPRMLRGSFGRMAYRALYDKLQKQGHLRAPLEACKEVPLVKPFLRDVNAVSARRQQIALQVVLKPSTTT